MQRKSNAVSGWVNFPIGHPDYVSTGEGGMVVKLVVIDAALEPKAEWAMCAGTAVFDVLQEGLVGDDRRPCPESLPFDPKASPEVCQAQMLTEEAQYRAWQDYHYPNLHEEATGALDRHLSRPYLACLVVGSSGWSGYAKKTGNSWRCKFSDLTSEGQALYTMFENLYPGCDLHLLTYLDT